MFTNKLYFGYVNIVTDIYKDEIYSKRLFPTILYRKNDEIFIDIINNMKQVSYNSSDLNIGDEFINLRTLVSLNKYIFEFNEQNNTTINLGICSSRKKLIKTLAGMKTTVS